MPVALLACLIVLVALGLVERVARDRAWRAVPIRVHVNGSRGKSTVTRLVWSALREAGVPVMAKTTGTAARLLFPDGTERPLARRAPASIREQLFLLRKARRLGARAIVVECMALDPELQWLSERQMVRATVGVITNVRLDHTEIMGGSREEIAASLANTIPPKAAVVTGEERCLSVLARVAAARHTRLIPAAAARRDVEKLAAAEASLPAWLLDDMALALCVTREVGVGDETAVRGFLSAPPDPGALREGVLDIEGRSLPWLDATAANDPDSLAALAASAPGEARAVVIYHHRHDRSPRLACFARQSALLAAADHVVLIGDRPPWSVTRMLRRMRSDGRGLHVSPRRLAALVRQQPAGTRLVFCGNTRGLDLPRLLEEMGRHG